MTIYRMYADFGDRVGFWVQHRAWRNTCALVVSVGGRRIGKLAGRAPLYGSPAVRVRWHDVRSGRPVCPPMETDGTESLADPGDIHYGFIAEPSWARAAAAIPYVCPPRPQPAALAAVGTTEAP